MKSLEYNDDYQWFGDLNYYRGLVIIIIITTKIIPKYFLASFTFKRQEI